MAINKDEIEKYIFDPENPKQCKSYDLLLKIAKKDNYTFFSPEFLQYFFIDQIITKELEDSLWDKPDNYYDLTPFEKLEVYKRNYTELELKDFVDRLKINVSKIINFSFFKKFSYLTEDSIDYSNKSYLSLINNKNIDHFLTMILSSYSDYSEFEDEDSSVYINKYLFQSDNYLSNLNIESMLYFTENEEKYFNHYIFFSKSLLSILNLPIMRSSIFITLEDNIEKFLEYKNNNIKPIFLKKIEDVDILLNVLEQDLKKEKQKNLPQENISTLNKIAVKEFFSIKEINLNNLKDKKEIYIVGENGDGKSLLLQSIAVGLKGTQEDGLKAFRAIEDKYTIEIENSEDCKNNFLAYGSSRNNSCQLKEDTTGYLTLFSGEYDLKSPTKWLQYLDYSEQKENDNVITVAEAKKLLQELLNSDIAIDISPDKVTFTEKGSEVSFEQLSAGYRGVITIICDMIARLSEKQQVEHIKDFQGIVLIDEVELHLHPKWQYSFMNKLREIFPLIQFMVTTHSPTVLLGAGMEAVYYLIYKEDGVVKVSEQKEVKNDFLNDIQSTVFGFDVNDERINNPTDDDRKRQDRAKKGLLSLIETIEKGQ